ncbi:lactosylceramide 4-alpha-galactosyltransferase [Marchantia polymorpha subsp. ruderalis]|uniref:Alpha 1,4-glycosyltransferase domain-containing protein n=1 Tax=Marchantia polymorpha TaxID=3197 RepID=A0A2R6X9L5_MARPO|nr:hypothetical protein MARPO_0028s0107 [Marchantia polymorpha]BBN00597.1 hypothetical protein Mp_2g00440 [Marchantia polymorpha subsp. ruderalis]|eukprot:PTQ42800.1 hypothetical protein MARPO_0028s0107 [Marchantia polymorpha]
MQRKVEMRRSLFLGMVAGAIAFLCMRSLFAFNTEGSVFILRRPGPSDSAMDQLGYYLWPRRSEGFQEEGDLDGVPLTGLFNFTVKQRREWMVLNLAKFQILQSDTKSAAFPKRVENFFQGFGAQDDLDGDGALNEEMSDSTTEQQQDQETDPETTMHADGGGAAAAAGNGTRTPEYECEIRVFTIWIWPVSQFGPREQLSLESLFKTHPMACLVILSRSLDGEEGEQVLQPFLDQGLKLLAVTPDIPLLFQGTPAAGWYEKLIKGMLDPGHISLSKNLSNLMRLVALFKYGGVYLDSDVVVLRNFSSLGNVIGSQQSDAHGNWTVLNNAVMKFARGHPLMAECISEFAHTFDGNRWGHNGPYLVTRVVKRVRKRFPLLGPWQCDVLPPLAFYPVDWIHIRSYFLAPRSHSDKLRHLATIHQLQTNSYTLHLWNKETRGFAVQNGSILDTIFRDRCLLCEETTLSAALASQESKT